MSLVVAMALSGLEADHWNDELREMYEKGAQLVQKCQFYPPRRSSLSSPGASSVASSYQSSTESGISSLSPSSGSGEFVNPFRRTPFDFTYIGKVTRPRIVEEIEKELLLKSFGKQEVTFSKNRYEEVKININYNKRNILDLGNHIKSSRKFFNPAVIPKGANSYFENRSQISRLSGGEPPNCQIYKCSMCGCGFQEPHYL